MATDAATQPQPQKRRVRKRILIPSVLLLAIVVVFAWLYWRGSQAETTERNPASVADQSVTQLLTQDGRTFVRTALIVDAPPAAVWRVVSDYENHPKFMPYISQLSSQKLPDGRLRLTGVATTHLAVDWPFEIDVSHHEKPAQGEYSSGWHEQNKSDFTVNRGGWTLKPHGTNQTLLVFTTQAEMPSYPNFLIRNLLMNRVGALLTAVRDEVKKRT
jgi:uncharacterized membrane protein